MQYINKINGAVFFVDILGIGALTQNQISLEDEDFKDWLDQYDLDYNNQNLSASILGKFRYLLNKLNDKLESVTIAQLSDCAFIWSENISEVVIAANNFMTEAVLSGILCRGGLSFGEIIETTQNYKLGRFIVGEAVTRAVKLEGIAKSSRILIDQEFPHEFWKQNKSLCEKLQPLFVPFVNPLDFITYDEFKWYLVPDLDETIADLRLINESCKIDLTKKRLRLASLVRLSPMYFWNTRSSQGLVQLKATINFMSESGLLEIKHSFGWTDVASKRSFKIIDNVKKLIETDKGYRKVK
ncbi:hypothetical protein ES708_29376 [subsurface metagenome]